jgi:hypothetical protein
MVGLTGMLVMTTLLLSVSNNLPPTNYIKLIDIWMLFGMVTPFFDIIILTVNAYHKEQEEMEMVCSFNPCCLFSSRLYSFAFFMLLHFFRIYFT